MIIQVDEGYAFDYLSILYIKKDKMPSAENLTLYNSCLNDLRRQVDNEPLWEELINSIELKELNEANERTFDNVEKARYGNISAKEVDNSNMERFYAKVKLQNRFFPNSKITEIKS